MENLEIHINSHFKPLVPEVRMFSKATEPHVYVLNNFFPKPSSYVLYEVHHHKFTYVRTCMSIVEADQYIDNIYYVCIVSCGHTRLMYMYMLQQIGM